MSRQKVLASRCSEKTFRKNVYDDLELAKTAAETMTLKLGHTISAFKCPICDKFHIGRPAYGCDQKESFDSESQAKKSAAMMLQTDLVFATVYQCKKCQKWHLAER
jgi:predicted RNA-binding Zn-ribbon protein involved in translation (DUF1610 family)